MPPTPGPTRPVPPDHVEPRTGPPAKLGDKPTATVVIPGGTDAAMIEALRTAPQIKRGPRGDALGSLILYRDRHGNLVCEQYENGHEDIGARALELTGPDPRPAPGPARDPDERSRLGRRERVMSDTSIAPEARLEPKEG